MTDGIKTMIVDDEEVAAELLEILLSGLGLKEIAMASSGMEALEMFESGIKSGSPYKLVFLDILMPEMDGQTALKQIRSVESACGIALSDRATIIMTTALTTTDAMIEALFEGDCNDYLVKPVGPVYLKEILAKNGIMARQ